MEVTLKALVGHSRAFLARYQLRQERHRYLRNVEGSPRFTCPVCAVAEVRRVLRPGGFAVLAVPVLVNRTIEYPAPVAEEEYHVRAPGPDYFQRYTGFSEVRVWSSADFDERYQTWAIEDRTTPTARAPRDARLMYGARHPDYVPVCFV